MRFVLVGERESWPLAGITVIQQPAPVVGRHASGDRPGAAATGVC